MKHRILILGGTTESRELATVLALRADLECTLSLAGRTAVPGAQAVPTRRGGFGGSNGLAQYLLSNHIELLIDATHPFAAVMSVNAQRAAEQARVPVLALRRPRWHATAEDQWTEVADVAAAVRELHVPPKNVFLTLGRQEIGVFTSAPQHHYLIRSVDRVDPPLALPEVRYLLERGPFDFPSEIELMRSSKIEVVVTKNSGGEAAYPKILAARALNVPVLMIDRPPEISGRAVSTVNEVVGWIDHELTGAADRGV